MAQKIQTYNEMSTTKGHPWVPQESQDYVLRSPNVQRNNFYHFGAALEYLPSPSN